MPIYEVEHGGQVYEVEASSPEQAALAFGSAPASQPQAAPTPTQAPPGQLDVNTLKSYGSGVAEGAQRLKAGVLELAGGISDFFTRNDKAGRGAKEQFAAQEMLRHATAQMEAQDKGLDPQIREGTAAATQMGTLAVAPEAALPRATTIMGALAKNFTSGGIGGALTFEPVNQETGEVGSKMDDALGGGLSSAAIGLPFSLYPAFRNLVGQGLARVAREGRTGARVANAESAAPNTNFSLAQRTGVPELAYLERRAYNLDQVNFFADQTDQFIADATHALGQPIRPNQTLGADAALFRRSMEENIDGIRRGASNAYEYGLSRAATQAGPDTTVPIDNFRNVIREQLPTIKAIKEATEDFPVSNAYIGKLERLSEAGNKSLTVKELNEALRQLTALQKSSNPEAKAIATNLRNAGIERDLDALDQLPTQEPAIRTLLDTRAEYRRAMEAARALSDNAAYKLVGTDNPVEMVDAIKGFSRDKQETIRDFLAANSPDLLRSLKQGVVETAATRSGVIREAADSQLDLAKFQKELFDGDTFRASGLFTPQEVVRANAIADGLRVIQNNRPNFGTAGTPIAPEDVSINLVSRSGPFLARLLTRALTGTQASRLFTDPNVYRAMTAINNSTTRDARNLAARAMLMTYLQEEYPEAQSGPNQQ